MMVYPETFVQRNQHRIYVREHPGEEPEPARWWRRQLGQSLVGSFTGIGACHRKLISHLDQSRISVSLPKF